VFHYETGQGKGLRRFYHLRCSGNPPLTWQHEERFPSDDPEQVPILFEFYWVPLPDGVPPLIADHGVMLPRLIEGISLTGEPSC
jgi:hypothetical protein